MAKKKRRRPAAASKSTGESARVRDAVQELRDYYQLGLDVLDADRKNPNRRTYSKGVTIRFANRLGKGRDYVDKARQFAASYTEEQLDELCSLQRPDGMPLGRTHVVALLSVKDKRQRKRLQRRAAGEGWGTRRLGEEITAIQGRHSSGGRRPREPDSAKDAVAQIVKMCERWGRWYEGFEREEDETAGVSLEDLPKLVRVRMAAATDEIRKLERAARLHLNPD